MSALDPFLRIQYRTHSLARDAAGIDTLLSMALNEETQQMILFRVCQRPCRKCGRFTDALKSAGWTAYRQSPLEMNEVPADATLAARILPEVVEP